MAVLGCAACSNEADFVKTEADNNSIVLDISSATTPVTRAGATGAEDRGFVNRIQHIFQIE